MHLVPIILADYRLCKDVLKQNHISLITPVRGRYCFAGRTELFMPLASCVSICFQSHSQSFIVRHRADIKGQCPGNAAYFTH